LARSKISVPFGRIQRFKSMRPLFLICLWTATCAGQNVTIRGTADPSHYGKIITVSLATDFITGFRQKEAEDTIANDGTFQLQFHTDYTQPAYLSVGKGSAQLYVRPDFVYGITVPGIEKERELRNEQELPLNIGIIGADSTELNALIFDFQKQYNQLFDVGTEDRFLSRAHIFRRADSLQRLCDRRYVKIKDEYFRNFVRYSIASVNASVSRGENYLINGYIKGKPILYHHYEYMKFFNACFKGYVIAAASQKNGPTVFNIINVKASYPQLDQFMRTDKFLANDSLRELVILGNLWDMHYSADFAPEAVESITSQLYTQSRVQENKRIAQTMLATFNKLRPGSVAPSISARTPKGTIGTLENFKGRWVYINFFSTKNIPSLREMPKIASLKKEYGDKVSFLSICVDDSLKDYIQYLRSNPRFDWPIWFNNEKSVSRTAKQNYFVTGTEGYFLVSNAGYLVQSPALAPSSGIEYRFNVIFKVKKRNTKTGIR
jgi:thiol-disulfide isomerase/thioredoxin